MIVVCLFVMLGTLGLCFDLGRMFVVKNELQTFADAAALAAVGQLDGTSTGVQAANTIATAGPLGPSKPNAVNFETNIISSVTPTYATSFSGTYDSYATASSNATNDYRFIKVTASATANLSFLPVLPNIANTKTLSATATAGQEGFSSMTYGGGMPFMPDAHDTGDTTNFGFTPDVEYTLKWGNAGGGNGNGKGKGGGGNAATTCAGDLNWNDPNPTSQHGFIDIGQGNGNSSLRDVIVYGGYPNANSTPSSLYVGLRVDAVPGNRGSSVFAALQTRADQDTDQTSTTWAQYKSSGTGNYRRVVTVPIGDPSTWQGNGNGSFVIVGFGNFLLDPGATYTESSGPICATYIGLADVSGVAGGGTDGTKVYQNFLYR